MKVFAITLCLLVSTFLSLSAASKGNKITWFKGIIEYHNGVEIEGEIYYDYDLEIISLKVGNGQLKVFTSKNLSGFSFFDHLVNIERNFVSIDYYPEEKTNGACFFEILKVGEMSILRRPKKKSSIPILKDEEFATRYNSLCKYFDYYVFNEKGFVPLIDFKEELLPQIKKEFKEEVADFLSRRDLNFNNVEQSLMVVEFYNALHEAKKSGIVYAKLENSGK
ncbi:hypothetical protein [Flexithrix dorotheae]|uniref:hypothetical protein n=1 Tax=Flexithrix dorotheae TaxID=70993 RepID=UPI00037AD21B|nr:hypothetical protein [Flexithrix dorotheae]